MREDDKRQQDADMLARMRGLAEVLRLGGDVLAPRIMEAFADHFEKRLKELQR